MTEAKWLACSNTRAMLDFIADKASERKLRLFAIACCFSAWAYFSDERSRNAVRVMELFVDGQATQAELDRASLAAFGPYETAMMRGPVRLELPDRPRTVPLL